MRVVVAGSTGVIGRELLPRLRAAGHSVVAVCRSPARARELDVAGYEPLVVDAHDVERLRDVTEARPDVVVNQLTSLPTSLTNPVEANRSAKLTNALRSRAGPALADAAAATGARLIAQSISFAQRPGDGVRVEDEPLYTDAPSGHAPIIESLATLEEATTAAGGTVLRYGAFYGRDTYFAPDGAYASMLSRRRLPLIGEGRGVWSLIGVEDAAEATIAAIDSPPGVYNVIDDAPVTAAELFGWMAEQLGADPPRRAPRFLFSWGPLTIMRYLFDEQPAVSGDRARAAFGWEPRHPSWRAPLTALLQRA